ncbi:MAG: hypothetical protein ACRDHE_15280, partial [Ktedonobacterales bacterium]
MAAVSASEKFAGAYVAAKATLAADPDRLIRSHGRARRLWLAQTVCGAALPFLLVLFPVTLFPTVDPIGTTALLCGIVSAGCGFILARNGQLELAALLVVAGAIVTVTIEIA